MSKEEIEKELKKVMDLLGITHMPTRSELETTGNGYLSNHITRKFGGFEAFRKELGLPKKTYRFEMERRRYRKRYFNDCKRIKPKLFSNA